MTTITITVELEKLSGVDQSADDLLDHLAAGLGRENGARKPLRLQFLDDQYDVASVYEVKCVDAAL